MYQSIQAILLVKSFNLVPRPLDEGPKPKSGKLRLNLHGTCFGGKSIGCAKKRFEPRIRLGTKVQSNSRIQFASYQFLGNWTLDPRLKWALFSDLQIWNLVLGKAPGHWGHLFLEKISGLGQGYQV
jgi:hypothetical protein